jgi:hypothetical protein
VLFALLILIIPAFVLWGVGNITSGPGPVGQIGRQKVTVADLAKSGQGSRVQILLTYFHDSDTMNKILQNRPLINRMAWERLVMLNAARSKRIKVTDVELMQFLSHHPLFQRNGTFDLQVYDYILRNLLSMDPTQFEKLMKENLQVSKFRQELFKNASVSDEELLAIYKRANDKVDLSYVLIDKDMFTGKVKVEPGEAEKFYEENKNSFFSPAKADIEYIEIAYDGLPQRDTVVEKLRKIYPELQKSPEKFKEIAEKNDLRHGRTGPFSGDELIPGVKSTANLHGVAFALEEGAISQPIFSGKEKGTIYILRKAKYIPPSPLKFEEVKGTITEGLLDAKRLRMTEEKAASLYEKIRKDDLTLADAGKISGQVVKTAKGINSSGYIQNVGPAGLTVVRALNSEKGKVIPPITVREKGVLLVRVDEIIPADETEFEEKKEKFRQNVLNRKQMEAADNWFEENAPRIKLQRSLDEL